MVMRSPRSTSCLTTSPGLRCGKSTEGNVNAQVARQEEAEEGCWSASTDAAPAVPAAAAASTAITAGNTVIGATTITPTTTASLVASREVGVWCGCGCRWLACKCLSTRRRPSVAGLTRDRTWSAGLLAAFFNTVPGAESELHLLDAETDLRVRDRKSQTQRRHGHSKPKHADRGHARRDDLPEGYPSLQMLVSVTSASRAGHRWC